MAQGSSVGEDSDDEGGGLDPMLELRKTVTVRSPGLAPSSSFSTLASPSLSQRSGTLRRMPVAPKEAPKADDVSSGFLKDVDSSDPLAICEWTNHLDVPVWTAPVDEKNKTIRCSRCRREDLFSRFRRSLHNCRLCGRIICDECSGKFTIPSRFWRGESGNGKNQAEKKSRVCWKCHAGCLVRRSVKFSAVAAPKHKNNVPDKTRELLHLVDNVAVPVLEIERNDGCFVCRQNMAAGTAVNCRLCGHLTCGTKNKCVFPRFLPSRFEDTKQPSAVCTQCYVRAQSDAHIEAASRYQDNLTMPTEDEVNQQWTSTRSTLDIAKGEAQHISLETKWAQVKRYLRAHRMVRFGVKMLKPIGWANFLGNADNLTADPKQVLQDLHDAMGLEDSDEDWQNDFFHHNGLANLLALLADKRFIRVRTLVDEGVFMCVKNFVKNDNGFSLLLENQAAIDQIARGLFSPSDRATVEALTVLFAAAMWSDTGHSMVWAALAAAKPDPTAPRYKVLTDLLFNYHAFNTRL